MNKHTPGPWRWELNVKHHGLELCGGRPRYDLTVLDFKRWGMSSAIARFRTDAHGPNTLQKATDFARPIPGREHHSSWLQAVDHPDAHLIAAAPDLLAACEAALRIMEQTNRVTVPPFAKFITVDFASEDVAALRAAIAKAKGE